MFPTAWRIGSLRGIEVRVHYTWLLVAALVTWSFWSRFAVLSGFDEAPALAMAAAAALAFFASILVHELAHALEAQRRGLGVRSITLFLFGGVTESTRDAERPVDELVMVGAGPLASFVLAAAFLAGSRAADAVGWAAGGEVMGLVGWLNAALGAFNLLPGAPLDGGRILHSLVWWRTGDRDRARSVAARGGRVLGAVLVGAGLAQLLLVPGGLAGGLWLAFIGWFLMQAARAEELQGEILRALRGVTVRQLLPRSQVSVPATEPVAAAESLFWHGHADHLAVRGPDDVLEGVLSRDRVRALDSGSRARTSVRELMVPVGDCQAVDADEPASVLLERRAEPGAAVVVTHGGTPIAVLDPAQIVAAIHRRAELDGRPTRGRIPM